MNPLIVFLKNPEIINDLQESEWDVLIRFARNAKMLASLSSIVDRLADAGDVPRPVSEVLLGDSVRTHYLQLQARREIYELSKAFNGANYPVILLKGAAYIAREFDFAEGRRISDVDLLVAKEHLFDAERRLKRAGYGQQEALSEYDEAYYREWMHEIPPLQHAARSLEIDLHHTIAPPTSRISINSAMLFEDLQPLKESGFYTLSAENMYLHSAVHLFFAEELRGGIRDLYDLWQMSELFASQQADFWDALIARAELQNMQRPLYYALLASQLIFRQQLPTSVQQFMHRSRPGLITKALMRRFILRVLAPVSTGDLGGSFAQWALFVRSHWLRMPPVMLLKHLLFKSYRRVNIKRIEE